MDYSSRLSRSSAVAVMPQYRIWNPRDLVTCSRDRNKLRQIKIVVQHSSAGEGVQVADFMQADVV